MEWSDDSNYLIGDNSAKQNCNFKINTLDNLHQSKKSHKKNMIPFLGLYFYIGDLFLDLFFRNYFTV